MRIKSSAESLINDDRLDFLVKTVCNKINEVYTVTLKYQDHTYFFSFLCFILLHTVYPPCEGNFAMLLHDIVLMVVR